MKDFFNYLAPFAPDYSGAASLFYQCGAFVVICDPGGCSGNVCGYDEKRFYDDAGTIFSAALRDLDTIFGKDNLLIDKIVKAVGKNKYDFIALVGTPVTSVIATDLNALSIPIEKATGLPVICADTTGMEYYDAGKKKAIKALEKKFGDRYKDNYIIPLDSFPDENELNVLVDKVTASAKSQNDKIIIVHTDISAKLLKDKLLSKGFVNIDTASWFTSEKNLNQDVIHFDDEEDFSAFCQNYDVFVGDELFFPCLKNFSGKTIPFKHMAVSGDLFINEN